MHAPKLMHPLPGLLATLLKWTSILWGCMQWCSVIPIDQENVSGTWSMNLSNWWNRKNEISEYTKGDSGGERTDPPSWTRCAGLLAYRPMIKVFRFFASRGPSFLDGALTSYFYTLVSRFPELIEYFNSLTSSSIDWRAISRDFSDSTTAFFSFRALPVASRCRYTLALRESQY